LFAASVRLTMDDRKSWSSPAWALAAAAPAAISSADFGVRFHHSELASIPAGGTGAPDTGGVTALIPVGEPTLAAILTGGTGGANAGGGPVKALIPVEGDEMIPEGAGAT